MRNDYHSSNSTMAQGIAALTARLPAPWSVSVLRDEARLSNYRPDAVIEIRAPRGNRARVLVEAKARLTAQQASELGPRLGAAAAEAGAASALLITRFASTTTRKRLRDAGVSYLDLTGNARISIDRPAVLIETQGAQKDPDPPRRGIKSLKGAKAARLVRALCDWRPPVGVRELAGRAATNPGYTSRVLSLLEREDVIARGESGEVAAVKWQDLLRRWAQDYQVTKTNALASFLAPRGLDGLMAGLRKYRGRYALTGSFSVPAPASISPGRLLSCYVENGDTAAEELDLRPVEVGANVLLLEPFDAVVWERTRNEGGLTRVALSQCVVDLLTGTGREPSEAEALMSWMQGNESAWRA